MKPNRKETIVSNKPGDCATCPDFATCTEVCQAVDLWVDQDRIGRNSNIRLENGSSSSGAMGDDFLDLVSLNKVDNDRDSDVSQEAWERIKSLHLSEKATRFIYSYYMVGKRLRDIAIDEKATSQTIDQRHIYAKRSIRVKLEKLSKWKEVRNELEFKSIYQYDVSLLFYKLGYHRKFIAKIVRKHPATIMKIIRNQASKILEV